MKYCPKCNKPVSDDTVFCAECGTRVIDDAQPQASAQPQAAPNAGYSAPQTAYAAPQAPAKTNDKIFGIIPYILGIPGAIISLLAAKDSEFVMHHVKEALKFDVLFILTSIVTLLLVWTFIVPIAGGIFMLVLTVARIIAFFNACKGVNKPAPIVSSLGFLN